MNKFNTVYAANGTDSGEKVMIIGVLVGMAFALLLVMMTAIRYLRLIHKNKDVELDEDSRKQLMKNKIKMVIIPVVLLGAVGSISYFLSAGGAGFEQVVKGFSLGASMSTTAIEGDLSKASLGNLVGYIAIVMILVKLVIGFATGLLLLSVTVKYFKMRKEGVDEGLGKQEMRENKSAFMREQMSGALLDIILLESFLFVVAALGASSGSIASSVSSILPFGKFIEVMVYLGMYAMDGSAEVLLTNLGIQEQLAKIIVTK